MQVGTVNMYFRSIFLIVFICFSYLVYARGAAPVTLSPSGLVPVCSGNQLELMCTTTGSFLEWDFLQIPENEMSLVNLSGRLFSNQPDEPPSSLLIDSVFLNFSRVSAPNTLPLTTRLLISPADSSINGAEVVCEDSVTRTSLSTIIYVVNSENSVQDHPRVNFSWTLEESDSTCNVINTALLWSESLHSTRFSYLINIIPEAPYTFNEARMTIQVLFNITYYVSIRAMPRCGRADINISVPIVLSNGLFYRHVGGINQLEIMDYLTPTSSNISRTCSTATPPVTTTIIEFADVQVKGTVTTSIAAAVISSVFMFLLTFIFAFIIGCTCGACFSNKCKKHGSNESHHPTSVYETVLSRDMAQMEQSIVRAS